MVDVQYQPSESLRGTETYDRLVRIEMAASCIGLPHVIGRSLRTPEGIITCTNGVPERSILCRTYLDPTTSPETIGLVYAHESFSRVFEGMVIPRIVPLLSMERVNKHDHTAK